MQNDRVRTLGHFSSAYRQLVAATTPSTVAQAAVEAARWAIGTEISWCGYVRGDVLTMGAYSGFRNPEMAQVWQLGIGQGLGGRVAAEGRTITIRDYLRDPRRVPGIKKVIDDEGVRGVICSPVVSDPLLPEGSVLGVLYACSREPRTFTRDECELLAAIGRDAGVVLAGLYRQVAMEQVREDLVGRGHVLERQMRFLGELAETFARTGDLTAGLRMLASLVGGVGVVDQSGSLLGRAGDGSGTERASFALRSGDIELGRMDIVRAEPFSPAELELAEHAACVVALQLLRERSGLEAEVRMHGEFLDDLLPGEESEDESFVRRGAFLGVDLRSPGMVVCFGAYRGPAADAGQVPVLSRPTSDLIERLARQRFDQLITVARGEQVIMVVGVGDRDDTCVHTILQEILTLAGQRMGGNPPVAGVGRLCLGLADYTDSFAEASQALEIAACRPDPGQLLRPTDLGLLALLGRGQQQQPLRALAAASLEPIVRVDREKGSEYVKTLDAYLAADRHLERTAAGLHVHVNTLRNRLGKIQELLGVDLYDVDARFLLELALRVHAVLGAGSPRLTGRDAQERWSTCGRT